MIGIYKITNKTNGKIYIGQAVRINIRLSQHRSGKSKNDGSLIDKAIYEEGVDNFTYEVVEECLQSELNEKEKYYISFYNSIKPNGYNQTCGGKGGYTPEQLEYSSNIKEDLLSSNLTYHEILQKYDISIQTLGAINNGRTYHDDNLQYPLRYLGYHSEPQKKKCIDCGIQISSQATRCPKCDQKRQQKVERPDRNELVNLIYQFGFEATGRQFGVSGNAIKKWCIAMDLPSKKSDIIKLYEEINDIKSEPLPTSTTVGNNQPIKVDKIDLLTEEVIETFDSYKEAARSVGGAEKASHIAEVCKGRRKTAYGFIWRHAQN